MMIVVSEVMGEVVFDFKAQLIVKNLITLLLHAKLVYNIKVLNFPSILMCESKFRNGWR